MHCAFVRSQVSKPTNAIKRHQIAGFRHLRGGVLGASRFAPLGVSIGRAKGRPELVAAMRGIGQTQQEVAGKLGVDQKTVSNDLNRNFPNESEPPTITNSRGQSRPATYKKSEPTPKPRAEPVTTQFTSAVAEMGRATSCFARLGSTR